MKKKILMGVFIFSLLALPLLTYAAQQGYVSSLYLGSGAVHSGATRSYSYSNHRFEFIADSVVDYNAPHRLVVGLYKKNFIGSTLQSRKDASFTVGNKATVLMGNHGSGNKYYGFGASSNALNSSGGTGTNYSGVHADWVSMVSYE